MIKNDEQAASIDLGPLTKLKGKWEGTGGLGRNLIAVPGHPLFKLEVIPYKRKLDVHHGGHCLQQKKLYRARRVEPVRSVRPRRDL